MTDAAETIVSPGWLLRHRHDPDLRIVDATYKMPGVTPTAAQSYRDGHVSGAVFFDIDEIAAPDTGVLPHMLPSPERFAESVSALGIGDGTRVVLYDTAGIHGPARAWWMFRVFGHDRVHLLEGGLKRWKVEGHPVDTVPPASSRAVFTPRLRPELVRDKAALLADLDSSAEQVFDARAAVRFEGSTAEPWPGRRSGHIPGSRNLDYTTLLDPETGAPKPASELRRLFAAAGYREGKPVVTSCGSGITACVLALGLHLAGLGEAAVYDGSWAEWGLPGPLPVATGPAPG